MLEEHNFLLLEYLKFYNISQTILKYSVYSNNDNNNNNGIYL